MRALRYDARGWPAGTVLKLVDVPTPTPKTGEVIVKVAAASINPVDFKVCACAVVWK